MKVMTIRVKKKHIPALKTLIPGATPKEIMIRALDLGLEILQAAQKAASNN